MQSFCLIGFPVPMGDHVMCYGHFGPDNAMTLVWTTTGSPHKNGLLQYSLTIISSQLQSNLVMEHGAWHTLNSGFLFCLPTATVSGRL